MDNNNAVKRYREKVLKTISDYEKTFDPVEQYEITDAIEWLYEYIRSISVDERVS